VEWSFPDIMVKVAMINKIKKNWFRWIIFIYKRNYGYINKYENRIRISCEVFKIYLK